jgi:hypothetical protein
VIGMEKMRNCIGMDRKRVRHHNCNDKGRVKDKGRGKEKEKGTRGLKVRLCK